MEATTSGRFRGRRKLSGPATRRRAEERAEGAGGAGERLTTRVPRWLVALLFAALLTAFAAGIWGTIVRPAAYEVRCLVAARPAANLILVNHEPIPGLGMGAMELMAVFADPALLDAADPKPGERVRLAVRREGDRLSLLRIEKIY